MRPGPLNKKMVFFGYSGSFFIAVLIGDTSSWSPSMCLLVAYNMSSKVCFFTCFALAVCILLFHIIQIHMRGLNHQILVVL